jgi:hypothetical protein
MWIVGFKWIYGQLKIDIIDRLYTIYLNQPIPLESLRKLSHKFTGIISLFREYGYPAIIIAKQRTCSQTKYFPYISSHPLPILPSSLQSTTYKINSF